MDYLLQKHKGRIISLDNNYMVYINKKNYYLVNKSLEGIELVVDNENLEDHLVDMLINTFDKNIIRFTEWVLKEYNFDDDIEGFDDTDSDDDTYSNTNKNYLYSELLKEIDTDRVLKIYSYGKKHRRRGPPDIEATFNACILSGKRKGLNLKKMNGLSDEVQKSVETSKNFDQFLSMIVQKIENKDLHCIGIYCSAGRHRSVTCCEILKKRLYPKSSIFHIELKKHT